jgi:predicted HicB family RNase H-like nuclease
MKGQSMPVAKLTATVDEKVLEECKRLAKEEQRSLSNWVSRVLSEKVKESRRGKKVGQ